MRSDHAFSVAIQIMSRTSVAAGVGANFAMSVAFGYSWSPLATSLTRGPESLSVNVSLVPSMLVLGGSWDMSTGVHVPRSWRPRSSLSSAACHRCAEECARACLSVEGVNPIRWEVFVCACVSDDRT